ncbi:MAG: sigma-70 family RNA polymerase sigma factor [Acidimicrobiia bacterium]
MSPFEEEFQTVLEAAQAGAEWAWADLYRDLAGSVMGYLASRGAREPEDLTSEVFLKAARRIHDFSGDSSSFRSWIFVIAHRKLIDERRFHGRRPDLTELTDGGPSLDEGGNVEREAMDRLITEELRETFETLTDGQRDVLALRIIAGLTLEQTAHAMGKKTGAVKALQRRALEALREAIDQENVTL